MNRIKNLVKTKQYISWSKSEVEEVARQEFKKFNNDKLKIKFLEQWYQNQPAETLSMSPDKCAKLLVESGTYEGGQ